MRKFLTFLFTLYIISNLCGQSKKRIKSSGEEFYFGVGILFDNVTDIPYMGLQILNFGYYRLFEKKIVGLEFEGSYFTTTGFNNDDEIRDVQHFMGEISAFQIYKLKEVNNIQFFGGFSLSALFRRDKMIPYDIKLFPITETTIFGNGGVKIVSRIKMTKKIIILVQTKLTILESGFNFKISENPSIPIPRQKETDFEYNFLRMRTNFLIGLSFKF